MVDDISNIKFTSNKGGIHDRGPLSRKSKKDFRKILGKDRREDEQNSKDKEKVTKDKSIKGKEDYN